MFNDTLVKDTYRICIIVPPGNPHAACFVETGILLKNTFDQLTIDCDLTLNKLSKKRINIILGGNVLHSLTLTNGYPYILFQLEQLSDNEGWYSPHKKYIFIKAIDVWDFSNKNVKFLKSKGINAKLLPLGYNQKSEIIPEKTLKDIDILFYGSLNTRRKKILDSLSNDTSLNVHTAFNVYGNSLYNLIARSKIVLNIHFYQTSIFETVRMSFLLNNRSFIVSEECDSYPFKKVALCFRPYEEIIDTCIHFIQHQKEIDISRMECYEQFKSNYPMVKLLATVLGL